MFKELLQCSINHTHTKYKVGKRLEQTLHTGSCTNGQSANEKVMNIVCHQGNANTPMPKLVPHFGMPIICQQKKHHFLPNRGVLHSDLMWPRLLERSRRASRRPAATRGASRRLPPNPTSTPRTQPERRAELGLVCSLHTPEHSLEETWPVRHPSVTEAPAGAGVSSFTFTRPFSFSTQFS